MSDRVHLVIDSKHDALVRVLHVLDRMAAHMMPWCVCYVCLIEHDALVRLLECMSVKTMC